MNIVDAVKQAKNPREAILTLAYALEDLQDRIAQLETAGSWDDWGDGQEPVKGTDAPVVLPEQLDEGRLERQHQEALAAMSNTDAREIVVPAPSAEKMEQRRMFERQQLRLREMLTSLGQDDPDVDWNDVYAKGGPWWLYNANRELVMSYDMPVRQQMVADLEQDSPQLAFQMSIDVLKQPAGEPDFENGSGALAVGTVGVPKR